MEEISKKCLAGNILENRGKYLNAEAIRQIPFSIFTITASWSATGKADTEQIFSV